MSDTDPNQRYFRSLPPSRRAAAARALNGNGPAGPGPRVRLPSGMVIGRSRTGCTAEAETRLYQDFPSWYRAKSITAALRPMRREKVRADSRYQAANLRWARCMRAAGYVYASPDAARTAFLDAAVPRPRELEIRTAVAEARCAATSGLAAVARGLDADYASRLRARYRRDVRSPAHPRRGSAREPSSAKADASCTVLPGLPWQRSR